MKILKVKCPKCKKEFNYYTSKFRPFCCERCKMVDLGSWFDESYSVAAEVGPDVFEEQIEDMDENE